MDDIQKLAAGLEAVASLIDVSAGVAGLHRNGDLATWDELRTGGRFEGWLIDFDAALAVVAKYERAESERSQKIGELHDSPD